MTPNMDNGHVMDNPFLKRIRDGSIQNEEDLRGLFRKSAKTLHPDTSPYTQTGIAFDRLNQSFEEALIFLRLQTSKSNEDKLQSAQAFYHNLRDALARGYPLTKGREYQDSSLKDHIHALCLSFQSLPTNGALSFFEMENERDAMLNAHLPLAAGASEQSAWEAVEAFFYALCNVWFGKPEHSQQLARAKGKEAIQKMRRRSNTKASTRVLESLAAALETF